MPTLHRLPPNFFNALDPSYGGPGSIGIPAPSPAPPPDLGPTPGPAMDAFSLHHQPSYTDTQEYGDYIGDVSRLREALQPPKPIGTLRALAGAFVGSRSPMLGSFITGDYQRQRRIAPLMQQYQLSEDVLKQNEAMENAAAMNRYHRALANWAEYRPELERNKLDVTEQEKQNTEDVTLAGKGLKAHRDEGGRIIGLEQLPWEMVPGVRKLIPDIDKKTGQRFYRITVRGQEIGQLKVNEIPAFMQRESSTTDFQTDVNGTMWAFPKRTISGPMLGGGGGGAPLAGAAPEAAPGAPPTVPPPRTPPRTATVITGPAAASGAFGATPAIGGVPVTAPSPQGGPRVPFQKKVPDMVTGTTPDGRQVAGTPQELSDAGVVGATKLQPGLAETVNMARILTQKNGLFDSIEKDLAAFKPGELEGLAPRWKEFMAGTIGHGDPRYVRLRTDLNGLSTTAVVQVHMGRRGGSHMLEHFEDLADAHKMDKDTLQTAVQTERNYIEERAMRPKKRSGGVGGGVPGPGGYAAWKAAQ